MLFSLNPRFGTLMHVKSYLIQLLTACFLFFVLAITMPTAKVFAACGYYPGTCSPSTVYCRDAGNGQALCCATQAECAAQPTITACVPSEDCLTTGKTCCSGKSKTVPAITCTSGKLCIADATTTPKSKPLSDQCNNLPDGATKTACTVCMADNTKVWTAIGCVDPTAQGLISKFLPFGIGIAGGIALLLILFGALQMMMSAGNPEKLNAGKELVSAAITGLLFIIFSIFILRLVGVEILNIPGFH